LVGVGTEVTEASTDGSVEDGSVGDVDVADGVAEGLTDGEAGRLAPCRGAGGVLPPLGAGSVTAWRGPTLDPSATGRPPVPDSGVRSMAAAPTRATSTSPTATATAAPRPTPTETCSPSGRGSPR